MTEDREKEPETELEAAEKVEERVEAEEEVHAAEEEAAPKAEPVKAPPQPQKKKGLMERRKSFSQSSVPNAHRGYNPRTPIVMMCIIGFMVVLSVVFAAVTF